MSKERRLGRGLEALLGRMTERTEPTASAVGSDLADEPAGTVPMRRRDEPSLYDPDRDDEQPSTFATPQPTHDAAAMSEMNHTATPGDPNILQVDVHLIESNPFQPRRDFDDESLDSLAESLGDHGLLQPLVVRRVDQSYQLIAGERRFRAAKKAGWREVAVKVVEADDRTMAELAIVENLQRKDLNALEKAASFQQYLQVHQCTQEELARRLKIDRSTIANLIRLLELPNHVQQAIRQGRVTPGHARALLPLGDHDAQNAFCDRIQHEGLSVREVERQVQEIIAREDTEPLAVIGMVGEPSTTKQANPQLAELEQEFRSALGAKVKLTHNAKGRGKLVIHFTSHEEFERLRRHLLGTDSPMPIEKAG